MPAIKYLDDISQAVKSDLPNVIQYCQTLNEDKLKDVYDIVCCYTAFPVGVRCNDSTYTVPVCYSLDFLPLKKLVDLVPIKHVRKTSYYTKYQHKDFYLSMPKLKLMFDKVIFSDEDVEKLQKLQSPLKAFLNLIPSDYVNNYIPYKTDNKYDFKDIYNTLLSLKEQLEQIMTQQNVEIKYRHPYIDVKTGTEMMVKFFGNKNKHM